MRLRDLGLAIGTGVPGAFNAITDVDGVRVGQTTLIEGDAAADRTTAVIRTGVTVIQPREGRVRDMPAFAGASTLNGNGEFTGLEWVRESGLLTTPIAITNTHSVGTVRDALVGYDADHARRGDYWSMPVVGETYDGGLNDINGLHVRAEHVHRALQGATGGPVAEGNVGGGTGMTCHEFKGGTGSSSRVLGDDAGGWTVGVLVQANYGRREDLRVDGWPVGRVLTTDVVPAPATGTDRQTPPGSGSGSIIIVVVTDAPLLPDQCRRLAQRTFVGLARVGGGCADSSGDIALAFSTANADIPAEYLDVASAPFTVLAMPHQGLSPLFTAVADATEEAICNALLSARTMTGRDGVVAHALEPERLVIALRQLRSV